MAKIVGLGSCVENVEMIVLFENGEKLKTSWNKFNCEGNASTTLEKVKLIYSRLYRSVRLDLRMVELTNQLQVF